MKRDIGGLQVQDMQANLHLPNQTLIAKQSEIMQLKNENARLVMQLDAKNREAQQGVPLSRHAGELEEALSKYAEASQRVDLLLTLLNAAEATLSAQTKNSIALVAAVDSSTARLNVQAEQIAELRAHLAEIKSVSWTNGPQ